jgi:hypothetical protein
VRLHRVEVNWAPWSDVIWAGTPKRQIQFLMRVSRQAMVSMLSADQRYCLQHSAGMVNDGEEVPEPLLGNQEWSYNVHVDV